LGKEEIGHADTIKKRQDWKDIHVYRACHYGTGDVVAVCMDA
jgi:hypothetical protein